jgi:transcriptional regulator with XRE-family HTH domain
MIMTVGERIKQIRKEKGLTQTELASRLGVSQAMITQYENGQRGPKTFETVRKIAAALEVSPEDILGKDLENTMREEERFDSTVDHFIGWLRGMGVIVGHAKYEDDNGKDKIAIFVDLEGGAIDIEPKVKEVMELTFEHFKVGAKHLGLKV